VNTTSPRVLKATIVETQKQRAIIMVTQSFNAIITTIGVETIIVPNTNVVRRGVVIGFTTNLGHGSSGFLVGRNLSKSSGLPTTNTRVVGTSQMVFNPIMATHVNKIIHRSSMNSINIIGYTSRN